MVAGVGKKEQKRIANNQQRKCSEKEKNKINFQIFLSLYIENTNFWPGNFLSTLAIQNNCSVAKKNKKTCKKKDKQEELFANKKSRRNNIHSEQCSSQNNPPPPLQKQLNALHPAPTCYPSITLASSFYCRPST